MSRSRSYNSENAHACMQPCIPDHFQNLIKKVGEEEQDGNPLTDSPEVVPSISVAARVVQLRASSNEQGQSKEEHSDSIHHQRTTEANVSRCNDFTQTLYNNNDDLAHSS